MATCPVCGERVGGLAGRRMPDESMIRKARAAGLYREGMCASCLARAFSPAEEEQARMQDAAENFFLSPAPVPEGATDLGLVTGYCILGTGPLSALFSSVTDVFGLKSSAYNEKAQAAEREALALLRENALRKGADAVYCIRINLTEATSGKGMLMMSVSGAAVRRAAPAARLADIMARLQK